MEKIYRTLNEFYPAYSAEHTDRVCRRLHFVGTSIALILLPMALILSNWWLILLALIQGYAFAWSGHVFFEHNKPTTLGYPWLSILSDLRMWWEMLTGKLRF